MIIMEVVNMADTKMKQGKTLKTKWFCPASLHNIFLYIRSAGILI